jgi:hypothetical protein
MDTSRVSVDKHKCDKEGEFLRLVCERVEEKRKITKGREDCWEIQVVLPAGGQITVVISKTGTIGDLKKLIYRRTLIHPSDQVLQAKYATKITCCSLRQPFARDVL